MALSGEELARQVMPFLVQEGVVQEGDEDAIARLLRAAPLIRERMKLLGDALALVTFLFQDVEVEESSLDLLRGEENGRVLRETGKRLLEVASFNAVEIEETLRSMAEELGLKPRKAFQPVRVAVTGSKVSPPLFESMELLGRERSLQRIARALDINRGSAP